MLAQYDWTRVGFGACTNQAGIGLGYIEEAVAWKEIVATIYAVHPGMFDLSIPCRRPLDGGACFRYAPAAPDASSPWRKPSPLMILDLIVAYEERLDKTLYVGDSPEDAESAARARVDFMPAWMFFGRPEQPLNTIKAHEVRNESA